MVWTISYKKNSSIACSWISSCIFFGGRKFGLGFLLVCIDKGQAYRSRKLHMRTLYFCFHILPKTEKSNFVWVSGAQFTIPWNVTISTYFYTMKWTKLEMPRWRVMQNREVIFWNSSGSCKNKKPKVSKLKIVNHSSLIFIYSPLFIFYVWSKLSQVIYFLSIISIFLYALKKIIYVSRNISSRFVYWTSIAE